MIIIIIIIIIGTLNLSWNKYYYKLNLIWKYIHNK
jgi:hypothetical protein